MKRRHWRFMCTWGRKHGITALNVLNLWWGNEVFGILFLGLGFELISYDPSAPVALVSEEEIKRIFG